MNYSIGVALCQIEKDVKIEFLDKGTGKMALVFLAFSLCHLLIKITKRFFLPCCFFSLSICTSDFFLNRDLHFFFLRSEKEEEKSKGEWEEVRGKIQRRVWSNLMRKIYQSERKEHEEKTRSTLAFHSWGWIDNKFHFGLKMGLCITIPLMLTRLSYRLMKSVGQTSSNY